jgi:hypothetical protein
LHIQSTDAGGFTTRAGFNLLGFPQATTKADGSLLHRIDNVDAYGNVIRETFGNGVVSTAVHDQVTGRLTEMQANLGTTLLQKSTYSTDNFGNVAHRTRAAAQGYSLQAETSKMALSEAQQVLS